MTGVLVMAHGTPRSSAEIESFYTRIRRGRAPSATELINLQKRYEAIGGTSPLAHHTKAQLEALRTCLTEIEPGRFVVAFGAKHTAPFIEDGARELRSLSVQSVIGLVLTPHHSGPGTGEYLLRAEKALGDVPFIPISQWYKDAITLWADQVSAYQVKAGSMRDKGFHVIFSAHSVPKKALGKDEQYVKQVTDTADQISKRIGLEHYSVAFQSAGSTNDEWLGPALLDVLVDLDERGCHSVLICPVGFVSDHLEVLYDIDIEAKRLGGELGINVSRTPSFNTTPEFIKILSRCVLGAR